MTSPVPARAPSERAIIALVGAISFVNILDFMIVMPLGPDLAKALLIDESRLGLVGGAYTASASIAGVVGAFFLDRFDRRRAMAFLMMGLVIGTVAATFANDLTTLLLARVIAGMFGGPASSVGLAIISDTVPPERRGRAMGAVMGAFSVASVLGVPMALELGRLIDWRAPFFAVAGLGFIIIPLVIWLMPPMRAHLEGPRHALDVRGLLQTPRVAWAYLLVAVTMATGFMLIPNFSSYIQDNLHYPREKLSTLYLVGGAVSFFSMMAVGRLVDRFGSFVLGSMGFAGFAVVILAFLVRSPPLMVPLVFFPLFMVAQTTRNVAQQTLLTKVPKAQERAGFMSMQSAIGHMASAIGAMSSSWILHKNPGGGLDGMPTLALLSISFAALAVPCMFMLERLVKAAPPQTA